MFWLYLSLSVLAGVLLGMIFFGGLWWTVQKIAAGNNPYLLSLASFVLRTALVMVVFYLLLQADWRYLPAALAGFIIARTVLAYKYKVSPQRNEVK